jgi:hypothetical protein
MEFADTGDALKLDDIEDAVVGFKTRGLNSRKDPAFEPLARRSDLRRTAPNADRITGRFGRRTAPDPSGL